MTHQLSAPRPSQRPVHPSVAANMPQRPQSPPSTIHTSPSCQQPSRRRPGQPAATEEYVLLPNRLLELHRHSPTAIGIYVLIARLFLAYKQPVPLSRGDFQAFDPALTDGVKHVLDQLLAGGWLVKTRIAGCRQACYTPAWGLVAGAPRPWIVGPRLAKPRHVQAIALPRQLLDTLMGRVSVSSSRPALIDRYFDGPALHLADVGAYALTQYGYATPTPRLTWLGLVVDGHAVAPVSDRELLLRACQPSLEVPTCPELGPRGQQYLGWWQPVPVVATTPASAATDVTDLTGAAPAAAFFSPTDLGGDPIVDLISHETTSEISFSPSQTHVAVEQDSPQMIPGNLQGTQAISEQPPSISPYHGGGKRSSKQEKSRKRKVPNPLPSTPAALLLRDLDVRPAVVFDLADQPVEIVRAAIADGRARDSIRDLAGWVVSMVRDARDYGWGTALRMRGGTVRTPDAEMQDRIARMKATGLFRSDDDLVVPSPDQAAAATETLAPVPAGTAQEALTRACPQLAPHVHTAPPPLVPPAQLVAQVRQALRVRVRPPLWPIVERLQITPGAERWLLHCSQRQDQEVVRGQLLPLLGCVLRELVPDEPPRLLLLA